MTFLAVRRDASSEFVEAVLETLFGQADLASTFGLASREEAALWPALPLHPAARKFFDTASDVPGPTGNTP